ncbi:putative methyltransferase NSUN7 [Babylonia areolata]|uniref:putative methyltransferase NSUN7 n=1 Tax=Babylonia areolata TaxID=304850 RepID=UPI003FD3DDF3
MPPIAENRSTSAAEGSAASSSSSSQPLEAHNVPEASPTAPDSLKGPEDLVGSSTQSMDHYILDRSVAREFFKLEPCLHSKRMLRQAATILSSMSQDRPACPVVGGQDRRQSAPSIRRSEDVVAEQRPSSSVPSGLRFDNPEEKKRTFELALSALNYQMVFENILEDSDFFKLYPKLQEDKDLVMVVLWDYQSRKFQPRRWEGPGEEEEEQGEEEGWGVIGDIERAILEQQTKLKACLARRRIKASAPKIEFLLPDSVRRRSNSQKPMPMYAWVNALKTDVMEVMEMMKAEGLTLLSQPPDSEGLFRDRSFYQDPHCLDVLVFSVDCGPLLHHHHLVQQGHLISDRDEAFQDKSSCLAAHSLVPLSTEEQDVLVVNPGAGWVVAHLAVLLHRHSGNIVVVSHSEDHDHDKMKKNLELVGATKMVKVIRQPFTQLEKEDSRLRKVSVALIIADCSKSAINNLVQFAVTEGEGRLLLIHLFPGHLFLIHLFPGHLFLIHLFPGRLFLIHLFPDMKMLGRLTEPTDMETGITQLQADHEAHLRLALNMPKLRSVAYLTRSVHEAENEAVVDRSVEFINSMLATQAGQVDPKPLPWMVMAPVLPFSASDMEQHCGIHDRYVRFSPSDLTNGCFLVCLARRPEDASTIIARARSKGLLGKHSSKPTTSSGDREDGEGSDEGEAPPSHPTQRRWSTNSRRNRALAFRRLSSPVRPCALKVANYKVPEHHKVVFHPMPFK